ncbi:MAG: RHS repeat-associated core domain-containing protein, partial [Anaerolineae bacterium]|nr:RHS repeat-associated core domain-containing protein [Anaerolineae bacterium]
EPNQCPILESPDPPPPGCWETWRTIQRAVYTLAGQAIATRVITSPPQPTDGLFYFITDHLSSTRLLAAPNGSPVQGTTAHYLPYGDYRGNAPTATPLTERGYTGHHENREMGLTYMNARFYSPTTGRFLTADTLIPSPANPQSHNRYSYVLGNALRYTDPTGHMACGDPSDPLCLPPSSPTPPATPNPIEQQILDATVMILIEYQGDTQCPIGSSRTCTIPYHATVMNDHTLLSHNHFRAFDLNLPIHRIHLYDAYGNSIPVNGQILQRYADETSTLTFNQGTFSNQTAAIFGDVVSSGVQVGDKVVVITWDGTNVGSTYAVWANITTIADENGIPSFAIDIKLPGGASGGGIYFNGVHIANNWKTHLDLTGSWGAINPLWSIQ